MFGLVVSALSGLTLGFINKFYMFYGLSVFVGLLDSATRPAHQAMIADILFAGKRTEGFGMMRVISILYGSSDRPLAAFLLRIISSIPS